MSASDPVHRAAAYLATICLSAVNDGSWFPARPPNEFATAGMMADAILGDDDGLRAERLALRYARLVLGTPDAAERINGPDAWRQRRAAFADLMRRAADGELADGDFLAEYRRIYPKGDA